MSGLFETMAMSANALFTQQFGAQVTGANIGNANAPGYHREDVLVHTGSWGQSEFAVAKRSINMYTEQNINNRAGDLAYADTRLLALLDMQNNLGDLTDSSISASLARFFASWRQLSTSPSDMGMRQDILAKATDLTARVNSAAASLYDSQLAADQQIADVITEANAYIQNIAFLNSEITRAESASSFVMEASGLRDERDLSIHQLAAAIGSSAFVDAEGQMAVTLNGISLVAGASANVLVSTLNTQGFHDISVSGTTQGVVNSRITSGTLGGLLELRNNDTVTSANQLDTFASDLITAVNAVHHAAFGLDGVGNRNFFTPVSGVTGAAASLAVSNGVAGSPLALAAASSATTVYGNSQAAQAMASLEEQLVASSNTETLGQSLGYMIASLGTTVSQAQVSQTQQQLYLMSAKNLGEMQSGVSIEAMLLQLDRYKNAFAASTRFISVINEMLLTLQHMV